MVLFYKRMYHFIISYTGLSVCNKKEDELVNHYNIIQHPQICVINPC